MSEIKQGIVYVLTNEAMPGLVKIGMTSNDITNRMNDLNTTGVPLPFECVFACEVDIERHILFWIDVGWNIA